METKKWYYSKTIWGILIALLGFVLNQVLKVDIKLPDSDVLTPTDIQNVRDAVTNSHSDLVSVVTIIVGVLLAVYGRFKATTKVTI